MSGWSAVLAASGICYGIKLVGYLAPSHWLSDPRVAKAAMLVTAGLLGALVVVQTFASGTQLVFDARLASLLAAVVALLLRAPFIVVVLIGALVAAGLRAAGIG